MAGYLTEITFKKNYETFTELSQHKILLPFEYAKAFCDFISPAGTLDFATFFEDDLEFQEIIYEYYGDIDEDDFEDEVEYIKENARLQPEMMREIFDFFLGDGKITYNGTKTSSSQLVRETCIIHDLTGKNPDFLITLK